MTRASEELDKALPWEKEEVTIANKYLNERCGLLHLSWALDHYWGLVARDIILPTANAVYDQLVKKDLSEKNKLITNDADDRVYFIPSKDKKVWVHTSQCYDFLYIIKNNTEQDLHIRRIFRTWRKDSSTSIKDLIGNFKLALQNADTLGEYNDDHYRYSNRPSLEAYRKIDFQIPYTKNQNGARFYGDFRDGGYVLSYEGWLSKHSKPRVEGSKYVFNTLESLTTCYLPCVARDLELDTPQLKGYEINR